MTKFPSKAALLAAVVLAGCATSSGVAVREIGQPAIAAAYLPLHGTVHLGIDTADGAAMVIAPGLAVTNAHNANLVGARQVIGTARAYDLLFFRTPYGRPPPTAPVATGMAVTAYGQGLDADLRIAHGTVDRIETCAGCTAPAYFIFSNPRRAADDAGPGFSGGPVIDSAGRLVGITFGYKDEEGRRQIYAYDMSRVRAELSALSKARN